MGNFILFVIFQVVTHLRKTWVNFRGRRRSIRERRFDSTTTQFTSEYNTRARVNSNRNYIPMTAVPEKNGHSKRYA